MVLALLTTVAVLIGILFCARTYRDRRPDAHMAFLLELIHRIRL